MSSILPPKERIGEGSSLVHWVRSMIAVFPLSEEEIVAKRASPSQRTTKEREKGRQYGRQRFQMKTSQNGEREGGREEWGPI